MQAKYIVIEPNIIIVFPKHIGHDTMAAKFVNHKILSAGFFTATTNKDNDIETNCWGKSISLGLESRPEEDTKIARNQFSDYL